MTLAELSALIRSRRSLKPADMNPDHPISREMLLEMLHNATWAPNHGLTEPWRFFIFQGNARQQLADAMGQVYQQTTPPAEFRADKQEKMARNPLSAHTIVAACLKRSVGTKIPELEEIEAVACAVQNLLLSATAAGVGSYWSSPPLLETAQWSQWLGLAPQERCLGLIYLGHRRAGSPIPQGQRRPLEQCIVWK
jgi:nitroreductase